MTTLTPHKPVALAELPELPIPRWYVIDTPGADFDHTFFQTKAAVDDYLGGNPYQIDSLYSTVDLCAYAELALAEATRLVADLRDENERLREVLNKTRAALAAKPGPSSALTERLRNVATAVGEWSLASGIFDIADEFDALAALKEKSA